MIYFTFIDKQKRTANAYKLLNYNFAELLFSNGGGKRPSILKKSPKCPNIVITIKEYPNNEKRSRYNDKMHVHVSRNKEKISRSK